MIVIFILLQIVSNNSFAEGLIKIPGLITHYFHHTTQHGEKGNFFEYLSEHYIGQHQKDSHAGNKHEEDKDCNLPFKHCGGCCLNVHTSFIGFVPSYLEADYIFYHIEQKNYPVADDRIESLDVCTIWQPPKIS